MCNNNDTSSAFEHCDSEKGAIQMCNNNDTSRAFEHCDSEKGAIQMLCSFIHSISPSGNHRDTNYYCTLGKEQSFQYVFICS
jgi:hypothetical protein